MGRKTQITKEQMLEAGLQIIIRDGYAAVSIKTVAAELGCSTTPIAWSFESIENYRRELQLYAVQYMYRKIESAGESAVADYKKAGEVYVDMAINEPNLIRYLRSGLSEIKQYGGIGYVFDEEKNKNICVELIEKYELTKEEALEFIRFVTIQTEGLVSMLLSGVYKMTVEEACKLLDEGGNAYMAYLISEKKGDENNRISIFKS